MYTVQPNQTPLSPVTRDLPVSTNIQNVTASSIGGGGFGNVPDLSHLNPQQQRLLNNFMNSPLTYSLSAGGYLFGNEASNANSYYNKFGAGGGGNPRANRIASDFYEMIGSLPTVPLGTPALAKLEGLTPSGGALQPVTGPLGPTLNQTLAPFGQTYQGPWQFGERTPYYNPYGQYHPPPNY